MISKSPKNSPANVAPPLSADALLSVAVAIALAVFAAHFPALRGGFIWDDDAHVTAPALRSLHGLWRIWTEPGATQQYYPLLHSTFWLEHQLWGDHALGYHVVNLLLHATAATLLYVLLRELRVTGACLGALLFALHPVQVESVAWISEQKNTLSTALYLGAALAYLRFDLSRRPAHYAIAAALFALALLTKTVTATLPAALLVIFWWQRGRISWQRDVTPLVPWCVLGAVAGLFTAWAERKLIGAEGAAYDLSLVQRALLAGCVGWFYLGKLLWPANLTFFYPHWTIDPGRVVNWLPLMAALALTGWLWWRARAGARGLLAVWLLFAGSLFPVLGFFNVFPFLYSYVADHFQYLASMAVCAAGGAALARVSAGVRLTGFLAISALLLALGGLTLQQSGIYRSYETLLRTTLARNPDCWAAANNLGKELMSDPARLPEAMTLFERALALRPVYYEANNNYGLALAENGRAAEAIPHLEEALRLKPQSHQAHNNLGIALARSGRREEALGEFAAAAALAPDVPSIQDNWAKVLVMLGRDAEAQPHFAEAARLRSEASR